MPVDIAGYFAAAATVVAACMTAANLGPRVTGWGFVVFTAGSLAWTIVGFAGGGQSLLLANASLTIINAIGIWRWLGRIARFEDGAKAAEAKSEAAVTATLINVGTIEGRGIVDRTGSKIGRAVGVMATADSGRIAYVVAGLGGVGGIGERLVALPWAMLDRDGDQLVVEVADATLAALPDLDPSDWPGRCRAS